jgi:hypothetical protein
LTFSETFCDHARRSSRGTPQARAAGSAQAGFGAEQQMVLELRPAHNPTETYGFVGVVTSYRV